MAEKENEEQHGDAEDQDRRGFIKGTACAIGGVASLVPMVAAVRVVLDPLGRKHENDSTGFYRLCRLEVLKPGVPKLFRILADKKDKWSHHRDIPIGAVFVTRNDGGEGPPNITAFSTICPHLGCSVKFIDDKSKPHFNCPCHKSKFKLTGEAINDTPPRPLDTLEIDAEKLKNDAEVWVKYERFKTNTAEKKPA